MSTPSSLFEPPAPERQIFCNRTLNLRSIKAIGYDMDYTLIHYHVREWEERAYAYVKAKIADFGWPVDELTFDPTLVQRGIIIDGELGNAVQANRFGFVRTALHGTRRLDYEAVREGYGNTVRVDLADPRFIFLSTLFSLSEGCLFLQLVDLLDEGRIDEDGLGYHELWQRVRVATDTAHMEGLLKAEIIADPARFVVVDEEAPLALLDQKEAGKELMLITNSEWSYTHAMMSFAFDPHLPGAMTWRDLFDLKIVAARKPDFFVGRGPFFEVVDDEGLLKPVGNAIRRSGTFLGGNAAAVQRCLGHRGDEILYVGDHIDSDTIASKRHFSWRTALVLRELEPEIQAVEAFEKDQACLDELMADKERLETEYSQARLAIQRANRGYGPAPRLSIKDARARQTKLRDRLLALDSRIGELAGRSSRLMNPHFGLMLRAGNDKSLFARAVESWSDIYTSRVANFLHETPFVYLRAPRGSLPHDRHFRRESLPTLPAAESE